MNTEERDQLIQRYYDGETIGSEAALAERLLADDPEAAALLDGLRQLSDSIRIDIVEAVAAEDFTDFWTDVRGKLPKGPLTLETGQDDRERAREMVASSAEPLGARSRPWWQWMLAPAAVMAAVLAFALIGGPESTVAPTALADGSSVIEEVESEGQIAMVQPETDDLPPIVWFIEADASDEG